MLVLTHIKHYNIDELTSAVARGVFSGAPRYTTLEQLIVMIS